MDVIAGLIGVLGIVFMLIAYIGLIAPALFKDKKTGVVPTRWRMFWSGHVAAFIALVIAGVMMPQPANQSMAKVEADVAASQPSTKPAQVAEESVVEAVAEQPTPEAKSVDQANFKPLDLPAARLVAERTLHVINEAEQSLLDGLHLRDTAGIRKYVWMPLQAELQQWPTMMERHPDDQREHFAYCQDAALKLQILSESAQMAQRERTVESMKYGDKDETEYRVAKQQCENQLLATDSQIIATVAAEDATHREQN